MIASGYNPTNKDLEVMFTFAGGLTEDPAYVEYVKIVGYANNTIDNGVSRAVTVASPGILRDDYEPILMRDDNGLRTGGGALTIGADTSAAPQVVRTLEMWIKPLAAGVTISVTGTKYRNGVADSTLPLGEWSLIHYVNATDIAGSVTVTGGDAIIGQVVLYDTALTAANVSHIYKSYTGRPVLAFADPGTIAMSEPATPVSIYAHDWSIDGGGG
jgi:hypothetical protein